MSELHPLAVWHWIAIYLHHLTCSASWIALLVSVSHFPYAPYLTSKQPELQPQDLIVYQQVPSQLSQCFFKVFDC